MIMGGKWSWDANRARKMNGCGNPVDRQAAVRDTDGRVQPEWKRQAIIPPDFRAPADDPQNPHTHPENFPAQRMWAGYFEGWRDPARCERLDGAVRRGECVALGCKAGTYRVGQILAQMFGAFKENEK